MCLICVSHVFHLCSNVPSHIWQLRHIWAHLISPMCSNVFCAQMCPNVPQCVEMCLWFKCVSNVFQMCSNVFCAHWRSPLFKGFCVTVVNNKSNVFKCLFNTHLNTLNVPQMCLKCVSNVFKCVWRTFENVLVSNVCQTHLNTFETHLEHIWGTLNVFSMASRGDWRSLFVNP